MYSTLAINNGKPIKNIAAGIGYIGKYFPITPDKLEVKPNQLNFFGNYKLILNYSEDKKEYTLGWNVAGGRGDGAATLLDATYEIIKER